MRQQQFSWMDESDEPPIADGPHAGGRAHLLIMASAGTGKTYQLSNRYLKLLLDGEPLERILATTFTRKAAGEIFDRIVQRLVAACVSEPQRAELSQSLATDVPDQAACLDALVRFSRNLHRIRIDTLDAFFAEVARCFSFEMRLPGDWQIIEEAADARVKLDALDRVLRAQPLSAARQLVHWIAGSDAQRNVVLVLQGAVAQGYQLFVETRDRGPAAWQLLRPQPPSWNHAELNEALDRLTAAATGGTARPAAKLAAAARGGDWQGVFASTLVTNAAGNGLYRNVPLSSALMDALLPLRDFAGERLRSLLGRKTTAAYDLLRQFDEHYWQCKRESGGIRFDDVPVALVELGDAAGLQRLAHRLDGWIDHLLLDEFQDTSALQWAVLEPLSKRIVAHSDHSKTLFCVGDVKQAIYAFRGGTSSILEALNRRDLPAWQPLRTQQLNTSFRSDQAIIDLVNCTFKNLQRHGKLSDAQAVRAADWSAHFPHHTTNRQEHPGYACLRTAPAARDGSQEQATLDYVADLACQLHRVAAGRELAILVRTNDAAAQLMDRLLHRGLNPSSEGGTALTDSAAVRVALSALQLAEHPQDTAAAFHVAHSPLGAQLGLPPEHVKSAGHVGGLAERLRRQLLTVGHGDTLAEWGPALRPACSRREWYRWQQLLDMAYAYEPHITTRPADFIRHVEFTTMTDPTASRIQVMTIHKAKGLGFDRVIVTDLWQRGSQSPTFIYQRDPEHHRAARVSRYVSSRVRAAMPAEVLAVADEDAQRGAEDMLCHLYVALTRAKHELRVIIDPSSKGLDGLPSDNEGWLRAALTEDGVAEPDRILFERGRPRSPSATSPAGARAPAACPQIALSPAALAAAAAAPSQHGQRQLAVGSVFDIGKARAMQFGTLMHAWLEAIEWLDERGVPDETQLMAIAAGVDVPMIDVRQACTTFQRYLDGQRVQQLLTRSAYVPLARSLTGCLANCSEPLNLEVRNEMPVAAAADVAAGESATWGIVDRLVLWRSASQLVAAHVLDYKTDVVEGGASALRKSYRDQLDAYRHAIATAYGLAPTQVVAHLVALATDEIV